MIPFTEFRRNSGFNPYFTGSTTSTKKLLTHWNSYLTGFNPYFTGSTTSTKPLKSPDIIRIGVSILILLEVPLQRRMLHFLTQKI